MQCFAACFTALSKNVLGEYPILCSETSIKPAAEVNGIGSRHARVYFWKSLSLLVMFPQCALDIDATVRLPLAACLFANGLFIERSNRADSDHRISHLPTVAAKGLLNAAGTGHCETIGPKTYGKALLQVLCLSQSRL